MTDTFSSLYIAYAQARTDKNMQKILHFLAETDEASAYQIEKQTGMKHATVHKKLKEALKAKLIEVKSERKFRTGLLSKTYSITPYGLLLYLHDYLSIQIYGYEKKPEISQAVSEKISRMLLKQWQSFIRYVPEGYALCVLQTITEIAHLAEPKHTIEKIKNGLLDRFISSLINWYRYPFLWSGDPPLNEIAAFLNSEPELKEMVVREISERIEVDKKSLIHWQNILEKIQGKA